MTAPCVRVPTGLFCVCGLARSQPSVFLILCFLNGTHPGHRLPRANVTGASEAGYTQRCNPYPVAEKSGLVANLAVPLTAAPPVAVRVDKSGRGMAAGIKSNWFVDSQPSNCYSSVLSNNNPSLVGIILFYLYSRVFHYPYLPAKLQKIVGQNVVAAPTLVPPNRPKVLCNHGAAASPSIHIHLFFKEQAKVEASSPSNLQFPSISPGK